MINNIIEIVTLKTNYYPLTLTSKLPQLAWLPVTSLHLYFFIIKTFHSLLQNVKTTYFPRISMFQGTDAMKLRY